MKKASNNHTETTIPKPLKRASAVAPRLGLNKRTLELHAQHAKVPHYRIGGALLFDEDELLRFCRREAK
jgi:hypothetical protein